jgi:hypothetical protein
MRTGKLKGKVVDSQGVGIAAAYVQPIFDRQSPRVSRVSEETITDKNGEYIMSVAEGSLVKSVSMRYSELWDDSQVNFPLLEVKPDTEFAAPSIVAFLPRPEIIARVVTEQEEPAQGMVVVAVRPTETAQLTNEDGEVVFSTITNDIAVEAIDPYRPYFASASIDTSRPVKRVLLPNGNLGWAQVAKAAMVLYPEVNVDVHVVNAPLHSQLTVSFGQERGSYFAQVDKNGLARVSGLKEGTYKFNVRERYNSNKLMFETNIDISRESKPLKLDLASGTLGSFDSRIEVLQTPSLKVLPILHDLNWLGDRSTELKCEPGQHLVFVINPHRDEWANVELIQQLYGSRGFKVVGIWPRLDQLDATRTNDIDGISFPIIEDNEFFQLSEKFDIPESVSDWPVFAVFNSRGLRLAHGNGMQALIRAVRAEYLKHK